MFITFPVQVHREGAVIPLPLTHAHQRVLSTCENAFPVKVKAISASFSTLCDRFPPDIFNLLHTYPLFLNKLLTSLKNPRHLTIDIHILLKDVENSCLPSIKARTGGFKAVKIVKMSVNNPESFKRSNMMEHNRGSNCPLQPTPTTTSLQRKAFPLTTRSSPPSPASRFTTTCGALRASPKSNPQKQALTSTALRRKSTSRRARRAEPSPTPS